MWVIDRLRECIFGIVIVIVFGIGIVSVFVIVTVVVVVAIGFNMCLMFTFVLIFDCRLFCVHMYVFYLIERFYRV